jgi:hypothetical protein
MQPLKYLTADHPYVIIRDHNDGTCNIKLCRNKPKHYDPKSLLKKIHSIVSNNLTYITESKDVRRSGNELWQKLKVIAKEMVMIHGDEDENGCFKAKYKKSLEKQYSRINAIITSTLENQNADKKIRATMSEEEYALYQLLRKHPYKNKPVSLSSNYLLMF